MMQREAVVSLQYEDSIRVCALQLIEDVLPAHKISLIAISCEIAFFNTVTKHRPL